MAVPAEGVVPETLVVPEGLAVERVELTLPELFNDGATVAVVPETAFVTNKITGSDKGGRVHDYLAFKGPGISECGGVQVNPTL